jgi:hypothetical protein
MDDNTLYDLFGSLSREIGTLRVESRDAFRRIEARLDRVDRILNAGRIEEWARRIDQLEGNRPGMNRS